MTAQELIEMADGKRPLPTGRVNVRLDPEWEPLMRVLTKVEWRRKGGFKWLYWYWEPEFKVTGRDCGYAGTRTVTILDEMT